MLFLKKTGTEQKSKSVRKAFRISKTILKINTLYLTLFEVSGRYLNKNEAKKVIYVLYIMKFHLKSFTL